jgi:hypothetical protein
MNNESQSGTSHNTVCPNLSSDSDTETIIDCELCCVCNKLEPDGPAKKKSVGTV